MVLRPLSSRASLLLAATLLCLLAALPASAQASRGQITMLEDTELLLNRGAAVRAQTLDEFRALGVSMVKMRVQWRELAPQPQAAGRPVFDARNPSAYPPERFAALDDAVRQTVARGMRPFLMLSPPAPEWATQRGEQAGHVGVFKTDPGEFKRFVEAVGRRYGGSFAGLPRVSTWSIWNEPNHPQFMQPLSERLRGQTTPSSPHLYRRLYVAGQEALARTGHARDTVMFGEILPIGQNRLGPTRLIRPILFLREFFCLDGEYRPYAGRDASVRGCGRRFPRIRTSGFAYHAYTRPGGPRVRLASPDDATIGQIRRVERALDRIAASGRLRRGLKIYNTEFGLQTDPPDCAGFGTTMSRQAAYMNEAEYISFRRPRVSSYSNYLLVDDPVLRRFAPGSNQRYGGYQSGLRFGEEASRCESPQERFPYASAKQPGYDAFRTPIYVRRVSASRVEVFGRARPRRREPQAIEILQGDRVARTVTARGYFLVRLAARGGGVWRLRWAFAGQTYTSRRARALADPPERSL